MLPSFVSYYLGSRQEGYEEQPLARRALEGFTLGLVVTAGFLAIFGAAGIVITAGLRAVVRYLPFAAMAVGLGLVLLGVWLLAGRSLSLSLSLPQPKLDLSARNPRSVFLFGVAYALASLSCTLPVFLAVVGAGLAAAGFAATGAMFLAYGAGMATVLMSVALSAALLKGALASWFQRWLPYVHRVGAALLIAAGVYLIWFQARYLPLILEAW
jgi:cytochrome c biogenesis protein CcdA